VDIIVIGGYAANAAPQLCTFLISVPAAFSGNVQLPGVASIC